MPTIRRCAIYEAFLLTCPRCGTETRILALITEAVNVRAILEHIGEPAPPLGGPLSNA